MVWKCMCACVRMVRMLHKAFTSEPFPRLLLLLLDPPDDAPFFFFLLFVSTIKQRSQHESVTHLSTLLLFIYTFIIFLCWQYLRCNLKI